MLNLDIIRNETKRVKQAAIDKGVSVDIDKLLELDGNRRNLQMKADDLRAERNAHAATLKGGRPSDEQIEKGKKLKEQIAEIEDELNPIEEDFIEMWRKVPNLPSDDTPVGKTEEDNKVLRQWGEKPKLANPLDHQQLGEKLDLIDKERAAKVSGARFAYLKNELVLMQFALLQYCYGFLTNQSKMQEIADKFGIDVETTAFMPVLPPMMLRTDAYQATSRLKPDEVTFKLANDDLWLIGSAEHSLVPINMGETLQESELPKRMAGYSTSFRREVGSYGQDTNGILRMHHFDKLEIESFTTADKSAAEHELFIAIQEHVNQSLELPYQVVIKCSGDMGGPNIRGVDIETWFPSQNRYRETHSADYIGDYQARSLQTKVQMEDGKKELIHTNDATVFSQRTLIAILENYQTEDGRVRIPKVLQTYVGKEIIG